MDSLRACSRPLLAAITATAFLLGASTPARAQAPDAHWHYRIQPGDTLIGLSETYLDGRHGWRDLQRLNRVADPLKLPPGGSLRLPIAWLQREASVARVLFAQGDTQLIRPPAAATALAAGTELRSGDSVRTGPQSSLSLRFVDGSRLLISPGSTLRLEQLLVYGRSAIPAMQLELQQGGADSQVVPDARQPPRYELRTPSINLGVRGTEFRVQASADATRVSVLEGAVAAGSGQARITAGQGALARPGQAPQIQALLPAPDLAGLPLRLEQVPLQIRWPALPGAQAYRAQVYADGQFDRLLLDGVFERPAASWPDLPDGRYSLRLRAIDALGIEGRAADATLTLKARPEPPFSRAPAPDAVLYGEQATLSWTRPLAAERYRLQVAATPDFSGAPLLLDRADLRSVEQTVSLPPGRYHWRLASIAAGDDPGPFGPAQTFTLRPIPPAPVLAPPEIGEQELLLRWRAGADGARYQLQWSADPAFAQPLQSLDVAEPQAHLPRPAPGSYYLRLRTLDAQGHAGPWGGAQRIDIPHPRWLWLLPLVPLLGLL